MYIISEEMAFIPIMIKDFKTIACFEETIANSSKCSIDVHKTLGDWVICLSFVIILINWSRQTPDYSSLRIHGVEGIIRKVYKQLIHDIKLQRGEKGQ